jgi:N-dimethylarginine dimethylaminohydrolase
MAVPSKPVINRTVLMSGADYFDVLPLNPYEYFQDPVDRSQAKTDFLNVKSALEQAGINVIKVDPPPECQDGVFTANWGICRGDTAILSQLPADRADEQPYAESVLKDLGKKIVHVPYRFSGQGDSLPCGNIMFAGSGFRTDRRVHKILAQELGYEVISLETVPLVDVEGKTIINERTGWPDSYFYDLDLALCVLRHDLIAWFPQAFTDESQAKIRSLSQLEKIEVNYDDDQTHFDCNLISTGTTVIMIKNAPLLKKAIEQHGLAVITVDAPELAKGGGGIRCCALTLDN